jgi:serine/threonine protein kinase/alpha-tubulin suppressor-like RCC1 family protein
MTSEHSPVIHAALDAEYEIIRELGRGGTALVYLARERATGDEVAIKVIRSRYIDDEEAQARFAREARVVAQLHHPNIVPVRAVLDLDAAGLAIVMANVGGHTLKQRIRQEGQLAPEDVAQIVREIGGALEVAHAHGIVHRDIKPENIFIDATGRALLADFGLARSMTPDTALTMAGVALGTPAYMAPEQIDGSDLDARVDIYSLGLVAWEMLTGRRAWMGEGLYDILYHQKHELPPDVRELRDDVPDRLAEVIARAIEKRREARWPSVHDMLEALDESTPLALAPRRVSHGDETIRFVAPTPPAASLPVFELDAITEEIPILDVQRRRLPAVGRTATVVATLSVAALAFAFVRTRWDVPSATAANEPMLPILQGDVQKGVMLPAPAAAQVVRPSMADRGTAMPPAVTPSAAAAAPVAGDTAADRPSMPARSEAPTPPKTSSETSSPPIELPRLNARSRPTINTVAVEKLVPTEPGTKSVWGGPTPLKLATSIAAGGTHSCFLSAIGRAVCWGKNDHGQLGGASPDGPQTAVSLNVQWPLVAIAAGGSHACAITRDGAALCWGNNDHGQAGVQSRGPRVAPSLVPEAHVFWRIAAGDEHTCAVDEYGLPWCWGANSHGQLGETSVNESAIPVLAGRGAIHFASIAAGANFTCGLAANGRASCWGENGAGQLGDGSNFDRPLPVAVASGVFTAIAAGSDHVCGLAAEGEAYCWGRNASGQLGDGTTVDENAPVRVRGAARFKSITAGASHSCGLSVDGTAYCWGQNAFGQLGTGSTTDMALPTTVVDGHVFTSLRAFAAHTCGVVVTGEVYCWGRNSEGQLGDGTLTHRTHPTLVAVRGR